MNKEKRRVPKLRFPGFTEDWEQRKLRNLLEQPITDGPHETPELYDSGIPFISVDAIVDNKIDFTKMRGYISKEYDDICAKKYKPQINDVYLVKSGATIGKVAIVETYDNFNIWSPLAAMRCGSITNPYFLYMLLQTQDLQSQVFNKASHGTQPNLSMRQLETFICKVPKIEEQKLISRFLKQLDDVITLHQRKLEHLKLKKKALLQKLFPKNGERYPELRFPGFTDAWEQRKLGDIATITGGGTPSTNISEYWNGDIDWYSPVEIGENRYVSRSTRKITKLGLEKSSAKILPVGTVLFTSRAGIGNTAILQAEGCTNQGFQSITPNSKELDTYFLYTMTPKLKRYGEVTGAGSTFVEVSGKQMEQMNLMIPSLEEQKHVSQLFELMDDAITLHQRKLGHLQLQKKALLQQMFV